MRNAKEAKTLMEHAHIAVIVDLLYWLHSASHNPVVTVFHSFLYIALEMNQHWRTLQEKYNININNHIKMQ